MNRFENVDVLAALEQLMRQNTAFYRNDFEIDKEIIRQAAASDRAEDKTLLWMSRPSGTYCFRERDVFLQDTRQHNTWRFYGEQTRDRILAYAVELTGKVGGKIRGNLYELDYPQHFRHRYGAISMSWIIPSISGTSLPRRYRPTPSSCTMKRATGNSPPACILTATPTPSWGRSCGMRPSPMSRNTCGSCCGRNRKAGRSLLLATSKPTSRRCMTA